MSQIKLSKQIISSENAGDKIRIGKGKDIPVTGHGGP
jgi:hypothetical protein